MRLIKLQSFYKEGRGERMGDRGRVKERGREKIERETNDREVEE